MKNDWVIVIIIYSAATGVVLVTSEIFSLLSFAIIVKDYALYVGRNMKTWEPNTTFVLVIVTVDIQNMYN